MRHIVARMKVAGRELQGLKGKPVMDSSQELQICPDCGGQVEYSSAPCRNGGCGRTRLAVPPLPAHELHREYSTTFHGYPWLGCGRITLHIGSDTYTLWMLYLTKWLSFGIHLGGGRSDTPDMEDVA